MFVRTDTVNKLLLLQKRIKIVQGGTWAGKTYAIIPILIDKATKNNNEITTVVAESMPALKDGAIRIFKSIMQDTGRWLDARWNGQDMAYTFATGSTIQFKSFDSVGKAKASGKRDRLFINEGNHIHFDIADALMMRTEKEVWVDYNPDEEFWAHTELLDRPDVDFAILTYKDNSQVPESILLELQLKMQKAFKDVSGDWNKKENIKNDYWANWCRVYIKGEIGSLEGVIFTNWKQGEFDKTLPYCYGQDFGFSVDPDTLIKVAVDEKRKRIYAHECYYAAKQASTDDLLEIDKAHLDKPKDKIIADCAEPRLITDLKKKGLNIQECEKGPGSVKAGIIQVQGYELIVTPESLNIKKELRLYQWNDKKAGVPVDANNHSIDPIRYAVRYLAPRTYKQDLTKFNFK